ncbi:putative molybdopterin converting factor subunit 1 [Hyphomonas polymorpha PS728]|uniref:Putative molybdopterin converting factor subunit 1 n=1 Tax=Hyphomonas polymorpha PS728 TaxID=1280954 RepID=A0A062VFF7_9PROT|nr:MULTISPECIES: MoaD/ThiS family protein [Hyphomonas]AXE64964.1 molybdopterin synthase sulfur carrier subunit [Hyphomonas sp. CACIAM 19H1]KCZ99102.1 putative molybdopterin converting factor subunit 1 [Hyphomonas polymorpha PS728]
MAQLLFFGRLADIVDRPNQVLDLPAGISDTTALRAWLDARQSAGGALMEKTVRIAINSEIVVDPAPVSNSDEIAFMPPVGGG